MYLLLTYARFYMLFGDKFWSSFIQFDGVNYIIFHRHEYVLFHQLAIFQDYFVYISYILFIHINYTLCLHKVYSCVGSVCGNPPILRSIRVSRPQYFDAVSNDVSSKVMVYTTNYQGCHSHNLHSTKIINTFACLRTSRGPVCRCSFLITSIASEPS